jgi:hypothetical protein
MEPNFIGKLTIVKIPEISISSFNGLIDGLCIWTGRQCIYINGLLTEREVCTVKNQTEVFLVSTERRRSEAVHAKNRRLIFHSTDQQARSIIGLLYRVYKKKGNRTSARYYTWITRRMNNWFSYSERSGF